MKTHIALTRAVFGEQEVDRVPGAAETATEIDERLGPGQIALITGPSGSGKSTILELLRERLRARGHAAIVVNPECLPRRRVIDSLNASFDATLSLLACCGLADGPILERLPEELSTGQRWRLALAIALRRAQRSGPHATILVDELGSTLDRVAAMCLCRTIRRWIVPRTIRAVCTTHDDLLLESLAPSVLVVQPLHATATLSGAASP